MIANIKKSSSVLISLLSLLTLVSSCGYKTYRLDNSTAFITADHNEKIQSSQRGTRKDYTSSTAGNLMATALQEVHDLDVALYPSDLLREENNAFASLNMNSFDTNQVLNMYPSTGNQDEFFIGTMRGSDIKKLIRTRIQDTFKLDIEVAGMVYHVHTVAGFVQGEGTFGLTNGREWNDRESYRVAINIHFFFSGETFPSYKFRNGLNFSFIHNGDIISGSETLRQYLATVGELPYLKEPRARYSNYQLSDVGFKKTYEIQGNAHRSPLYGHQVTTKAIVTAVDNVDWFPRGIDIIIQDQQGDGIDETSDALHVHLKGDVTNVEVGDEILVRGTVFEHQTLDIRQNMSKTVLRDIKEIKILSKNNPLPAPVVIGMQGRTIPDRTLSTWTGDLNFKPFLKLTDGIDFWESLEGMRVTIKNPRIAGFRGGNEELARLNPQRHLSLYIIPDGYLREKSKTFAGGLMEDFMVGDFNPEVLHLSAGNLTKDGVIDTQAYYNVGDIIKGDIIGNLSFESNLFGGGEYTLVLPVDEPDFTSTNIDRRIPEFPKDKRAENCIRHNPSRNHWPVECRPQTKLKGENRKLSIAAYNLENLAGNQDERIENTGKAIRYNLLCPDIIGLVEIQDDNGLDLQGGADAMLTIQKIIDDSECSEEGVTYEAININPVNHNEGGQPGGNIRVAYIYNSARVDFTPRGNVSDVVGQLNGSLQETNLTPQGNLSINPGRVFPNSAAFKNTRKSIIAQFEFKGEKVFVIGNHFNSKLGDTSFWGATQPPYPKSDEERATLAMGINEFVRIIEYREPNAHVVVLGDFNAQYNERSMITLGNDGVLNNLMFYKDIVHPKDRYTHNFNGNSSAIDFIFANRNLLNKNPEMEAIHINTDFMGRLSDHDPVIARFTF